MVLMSQEFRPIRKTAFMMFKKCEKQFDYFYNQSDEEYTSYGKRSETRPELAKGTDFHSFAETLMQPEEVEKIYADDFEDPEVQDWCRWLIQMEEERKSLLQKEHPNDWEKYYNPIAVEVEVELEGEIKRTGHIDRIDLLTDGTLCIVEYKTGKSYDPQKQWSLTSMRAEVGFYERILTAMQKYPQKISSWRLVNPTLKVVYQEKFSPITLRSVDTNFKALVEKIKQGGPWEKTMSPLCSYCPFFDDCYYPKAGEEQHQIFGELSKKIINGELVVE